MTADELGDVHFISPKDFSKVHTLSLGQRLTALNVHSNGTILAGDGKGAVHFIGYEDGKPVEKKSVKHHNSFVTSITFNKDGSQAYSTSYDSDLNVWDTEKIARIKQIENSHRGTVNCGVWDEERGMLITCGSDVQ